MEIELRKGPFFAVAAVAVVLIIGTLLLLRVTPEPASYSLARIERADTPVARERGLSGRAEIPSDYGMLFSFPEAGIYGFWMKDMKAPIDIIWLSEEHEILGIEEAVAPETYPETFSPPSPVRYVLEIRAGEARARGWEAGTELTLPK